jgi:hypothetical protein
MGKEVVHPKGVQTLEEVVGWHDPQVMLKPEERPVDFVDQLGFNGVRKDGEPIVRNAPQVTLHFSALIGIGSGHKTQW